MRKQDVFGKKKNRIKTLYLISIIFAVALASYFLIGKIQDDRLIALRDEEIALEGEIEEMLESVNGISHYQIGKIIKFLPNRFDEVRSFNRIHLVRYLSGLENATEVALTFEDNSISPFAEELPETVTFVRVVLTMIVDNPLAVLDFMDNLMDSDQLYFITGVEVTYVEGGGAMIAIEFYQFYNAVDIETV